MYVPHQRGERGTGVTDSCYTEIQSPNRRSASAETYGILGRCGACKHRKAHPYAPKIFDLS